MDTRRTSLIIIVVGIALTLFIVVANFAEKNLQKFQDALEAAQTDVAAALRTNGILSTQIIGDETKLNALANDIDSLRAQINKINSTKPSASINPSSNCGTTPYLENSPLLSDVCAYYRLDGDATDEGRNHFDLTPTDITYVP